MSHNDHDDRGEYIYPTLDLYPIWGEYQVQFHPSHLELREWGSMVQEMWMVQSVCVFVFQVFLSDNRSPLQVHRSRSNLMER